ncbi:uncharacterized protein LOC144625573 isoform X4 [Crassostrea virginica]
MPKIKKSKRIAERRAGLQESHQEAHVIEQHPKEHPVSSNRDGVLDKSPGQAPEVAVLNSEAGCETRNARAVRSVSNYHQSPRHHEY